MIAGRFPCSCGEVAGRWVRAIRTLSGDENNALRGVLSGATPPVVVPFQLSESQAREKFEQWQKSHWFAPSNLLDHPAVKSTSTFLPFWCFDVKVSVRYSASPGFSRTGEDGKYTWSSPVSDSLEVKEFHGSVPEMQVFASFKYRRDLAEAVKTTVSAGVCRPLTIPEAEILRVRDRSTGTSWHLDPPDMRQGLAWEFALRGQCVEEYVKGKTGAATVKVEDLSVEVLQRRAYIVYMPAFHFSYQFSEIQNVAGEIIPATCQVMLSGLSGGGISGERHFCPKKAQLATTGVAGGLGLTAITLGDPAWLGQAMVEASFWTFMAASTAGVMARFGSKAGRRRHAAQMSELEDEFLLSFMRTRSSSGAERPASEFQDSLRCDAEWRQWEESGKWEWNALKKRRWAEELWREQHKRRIDGRLLMEKLEAERLRREQDERRESRRFARWGKSHHRRFSQHRHALKWGGRADALGYYKVLGLDQSAEVTTDHVKAAFKEAALRWHPDRHVLNGEEHQGAAAGREKFQALQEAYEVLRDPEKRRLYDRGELLGSTL
eukprot:evm.model.scf_1408EXC.4 EVM.evm.TU.scf_1408EXC.4   scf_1408EXC:14406-18349(+)